MPDAYKGRHSGNKVNVGFVDGSIARKKADDLAVTLVDGNYENRSPLWSPIKE